MKLTKQTKPVRELKVVLNKNQMKYKKTFESGGYKVVIDKPMTNKTKQVVKEIERLINKYPWIDSKELFRVELEYLVVLAEREQMKKDLISTMKIIKKM